MTEPSRDDRTKEPGEIPVCFFCHRTTEPFVRQPGSLLVVGSLSPCHSCRGYFSSHVRLVGTTEDVTDEVQRQATAWAEAGEDVPFVPRVERTGVDYWIDREKIDRILGLIPELSEAIKQKHWAFADRQLVEYLALDEVANDDPEDLGVVRSDVTLRDVSTPVPRGIPV